MIITKEYSQANRNTFSVKPIGKFVKKYLNPNTISIDPFANNNKLATITNDLDPEMNTDYNMDALQFLKQFEDESIDVVLFDPPYSPRQVSECYKNLGKTVNMETTQSSFWSNMKKEIARITKQNGIVLCFGWNSQGIGKTRGFVMEEILLVAHGAQHNDTICTMERKKPKPKPITEELKLVAHEVQPNNKICTMKPKKPKPKSLFNINYK